MRREQIVEAIETGKLEGKAFIRWWRKENDFADYELVDHFVETVMADHEFEDFELLDIEQMWEVLKRWKPTGLRRSVSTKGDMIEWRRRGEDGELLTERRPYNARSIMTIFDAETRGDTLV